MVRAEISQVYITQYIWYNVNEFEGKNYIQLKLKRKIDNYREKIKLIISFKMYKSCWFCTFLCKIEILKNKY